MRKIFTKTSVIFFLCFCFSNMIFANPYYNNYPNYPQPRPVVIEKPVYYPSYGSSYSTYSSTSKKGVDNFNGFENIEWGTKIEDLKDQFTYIKEYTVPNTSYKLSKYERKNDTLKQSDPKIKSLYYLFDENNSFSAVIISTTDITAFLDIAIYLGESFGYANNIFPSRGVYMSFSKKTVANGHYNPMTKEGFFVITSKNMDKTLTQKVKEFEVEQKKNKKQEN